MSSFTVVAADAAKATAPAGQLVAAALVGIALLVILITKYKLHPFLSLTLGSLLVGLVGGLSMQATTDSFTKGVGSTVAGVGLLIALGAMIGKLLADSGGADQLVDTIVDRASPAALPWAMGLVGAVIGLPMFFEIGLVLLIPVILLVTRRSGLPLMKIGIPALAGLSAMHGFVPPHPGPLVAVDALKANLGLTLGLGVLVSIPVIALSGPVFASFAAKWVPVGAPDLFLGPASASPDSEEATQEVRRPGFAATLITVLLPVVLMMGKSLADIFLAKGDMARQALDFVGAPLIALLLTVLVSMWTLGRGSGMDGSALGRTIGDSLGPIAGILLIVAAGGGFKQVLVDTGIGTMLAQWIQGSSFSPLLLAWVVAVFIRLATGSATVATITAAGVMAPVATAMTGNETALLVLAIGAGSVFFSHVNDAGFWLVKEYFGLDVGQNIKTWSLMETIISVSGLAVVMLLSLVM
ncbi:gluconate:H+ symporter, GntP family [Austwickia chelonae]|uniref:Putative gluconate permease n=1 Tax=Austwickia chelonae NBRC 105200 TaxID=1184607 RepID=K6VTD7_9MICO|nr:gluconate:H+ symporter [Austwickia chelonae]GAB78590.1 putative gluconate permease [Austwickia chelonae NBRC 105200]SEW33970.1 gluconate:H+ symporter, GntP family [Austwickia chelonae]